MDSSQYVMSEVDEGSETPASRPTTSGPPPLENIPAQEPIKEHLRGKKAAIAAGIKNDDEDDKKFDDNDIPNDDLESAVADDGEPLNLVPYDRSKLNRWEPAPSVPAGAKLPGEMERNRPCSDSSKGLCSNLCRSRSAQSLKLLGDSATQDDKLTILATLFWVGASLLESDYEHEYLLGVRLLARVMGRLPLARPDARDRLDRTQAQSPPTIHSALLKGCTHPSTYEPVVGVLVDMIPLLELPVIDPSQSAAFPMTVLALLPYMLLHYEDANELCVRAACHIAQFTSEKSKKLENLGTVMTLYSRRTFSKESFQWTKCVVKYLWDTYSHLSLQMLSFLVEVLEKGGANLQASVLSILHCMLYYVELNAPSAQPVNADLLRVVAKFIDGGSNYKEAMKILKLVVTRSSSLVVPPHWDTHVSLADTDMHQKKELPGRTMDFTFDLSQTPVIGRKYLPRPSAISTTGSVSSANTDRGSISSASASTVVGVGAASGWSARGAASPRRSLSLSPADALGAGWRRPWCSQVIFSQSSELLERESSMASSLEEVSGNGGNEPSGAAPPTDHFGVFKDFDFLEYESESIEGESSDNFNWGVRRRLLSEEREEGTKWSDRSPHSARRDHLPLGKRSGQSGHEDSSDEEGAWEEGAASGARGEPEAEGEAELALRLRAHSCSSGSSGEPDAYSSCGLSSDLSAVLERLQSEDPPLLWVGADAAEHPRIRDAVRYAALEINEHLETYFDRRENAQECLDMMRSTEEVSRSLYKLIFQLLLLLETNNKMLQAVYCAAMDNKGVEMSAAVISVRDSLWSAAADAWSDASPAAADDHAILQLLHQQRWGAAISLVHTRNAESILERGELPEDEVTALLHMYCRALHATHPEMVAITRPVSELSQSLAFMMESLYKVSVSLRRPELV